MHSTDVCDDDNQLLYVKCSYTYPSGQPCSKPVASFLDPPLCGGHCDQLELHGDVATAAGASDMKSGGDKDCVHVDQS